MLIITNFKTYETALGSQAVELAKVHEQIARDSSEAVHFAVAPSVLDIDRVCSFSPHLPVFSQHVDAASYGSFTGKIPASYVKKMGAVGTILNHSENRLSRDYLIDCVNAAKDAGLKTIICAENDDEGLELMNICNPDFIAVEPPELIGGDVSVSTADPDLIKRAVEKIGVGKVIVGAGVKDAEDIRIAKELGASGILLASGVTKADDPAAVLKDLAKGAE